ncbi:MAG: MFS transporter [Acidimicrobiales bacterium]
MQDRRALAAVAAQFWINGMVHAAVVPRLPDIRDRLQIDVAELGLILTIAAVGGLAGSAIGGPAVVRLGTRRCIIIGTGVTLLVLPVIGLTTSVIVLTASLAVMSLLDVVIDISMNIQGSRLSARRATPVMNRLHGLWSLGTVFGGLVAVRVTAAGVPIWLHLSGVAAVLAVTVGVSGRFLLRDDEPSNPGDEPIASAVGIPGERRPRSRFGYPLLLGLLGGAAVAMELTTSDWAAFRLADDLGVTAGQVGLGFVAFTSGMVTGRFAGDTIQGLVGTESLVRYAALLAAFGLLLATVVPGDAFSALGLDWLTPTVVSIAGFYIAALGVSVIFPQLYDRAARAPGPAGRGLAAVTAGTRIAGLAAPVIVGVLADTTLSVGTAIALVTVPSCVIMVGASSLAGRLGFDDPASSGASGDRTSSSHALPSGDG